MFICVNTHTFLIVIMSIENLDCYFTIARQHLVCEDYAFTGCEPIPHIIVCDGCSSSIYTDVGARLLAMSANKTLREYFEKEFPDSLPEYADFGYAVMNRARHASDMLGLPVNALDATLLIAVPYHRKIHVYVYGDGYAIIQNHAGETTIFQCSFTKNMPYYLSYWLDKSRREEYLAANQAGDSVVTIREMREEYEDIRQVNYDTPLVFSFEIASTSVIAVISDGVSSFTRIEGQQRIPVEEVVQQLVAYKTTKGDFVKRRVRRMLKTYEQQGIYPTDDLAVATLLVSHI